MSYFDDFQLLNVTKCRMYDSAPLKTILTRHHYLGVMQGEFLLGDRVETRPLVYLTPRGITAEAGWKSPPGKARDNFYIEISGARTDRFFAAFDAGRQSRFFFIRDPSPFLAILEEMRIIFLSPSPLSAARLALLLEEFAALLEQSRRCNGICAGHMSALEKVMEAMGKDPGRRWDFGREAAQTGITLRHWNRLFAAVGRMSPRRFLNACRIRLARELLSSGELPIKLIALRVGFGGASEFTRFFKRETGVTPGQFRRTRRR